MIFIKWLLSAIVLNAVLETAKAMASWTNSFPARISNSLASLLTYKTNGL